MNIMPPGQRDQHRGRQVREGGGGGIGGPESLRTKAGDWINNRSLTNLRLISCWDVRRGHWRSPIASFWVIIYFLIVRSTVSYLSSTISSSSRRTSTCVALLYLLPSTKPTTNQHLFGSALHWIVFAWLLTSELIRVQVVYFCWIHGAGANHQLDGSVTAVVVVKDTM